MAQLKVTSLPHPTGGKARWMSGELVTELWLTWTVPEGTAPSPPADSGGGKGVQETCHPGALSFLRPSPQNWEPSASALMGHTFRVGRQGLSPVQCLYQDFKEIGKATEPHAHSTWRAC